MNKKKQLGIIAVSVFLILISVFFLRPENREAVVTDDFIKCLEEEGVVIYGRSTCPVCVELVQEYGGKEAIDPIYVDCDDGEEHDRCDQEIKTGYVPEIHVEGVIFEEWGTPENLARETGCEL